MKMLEAIASADEDRYRDPRTSSIIAAAIEVHRHLGPGLLESAYEECLCHELHLILLDFRRRVPLPVVYKGLPLDCGYHIDLIVRDEVVVELKAIERILPIHQAQLLTYLKLAEKSVGLLINFNVPVLTQGITRRVRQIPATLFTTEAQSHRGCTPFSFCFFSVTLHLCGQHSFPSISRGRGRSPVSPIIAVPFFSFSLCLCASVVNGCSPGTDQLTKSRQTTLIY
jgi:GxxExxY protein